MLLWIAIFVVSLIVLIKSSDYFTDSAEKLGLYFGLPTFVIGVVILSIGTSLPELISSIFAVLQNSSEIVIGNVIGSNVANILLIIGVASLFSKENKIKYDLNRLDLPVLMTSLLFIVLTLKDGIFTWVEGLIGLIIIGFYLYKTNQAKKVKLDVKVDKKLFPWKSSAILILTSITIFFGAKYTITSAIEISSILNIAKEVIAASAIALGTSLPELTVSIQAVRKKKFDMALGNVIGSNIFNTFVVLGIPSLISTLKFSMKYTFANTNFLSLIALIVATTLLLPFVKDKNISKTEGVVFITLYVIFLIKLFI